MLAGVDGKFPSSQFGVFFFHISSSDPFPFSSHVRDSCFGIDFGRSRAEVAVCGGCWLVLRQALVRRYHCLRTAPLLSIENFGLLMVFVLYENLGTYLEYSHLVRHSLLAT
ncbi:hypothetical protein Bca4012_063219 [Brassica carinata]